VTSNYDAFQDEDSHKRSAEYYHLTKPLMAHEGLHGKV
jgi:hypothetical protein